ncbi:hypothetical protein MHYP_G00206570 [Metynnis hypsauchen]
MPEDSRSSVTFGRSDFRADPELAIPTTTTATATATATLHRLAGILSWFKVEIWAEIHVPSRSLVGDYWREGAAERERPGTWTAPGAEAGPDAPGPGNCPSCFSQCVGSCIQVILRSSQ